MAKKDKISKEQVLNIPKLLNAMSMAEVARHYGVSDQAIYYWVRRLREKGVKVITRNRGCKSVIL